MEPAFSFRSLENGTTPEVQTCAIEMRRLSTAAEYAQAVELQQLTWGPSFREVVPGAILKISQRVGGVCAGAFSDDGVLQAFVYGLSGVEDGRLIHWSHMLAVRPELRDCGLGRRLKLFQRALLLESGVELMYWTFDPLVARNAHLNLNVLGVRVCEYIEDMYQHSGSPLHASGTDRLLAAWPVREMVVIQPVTEAAYCDAPEVGDQPISGAAVRIEIPEDISVFDAGDARLWRLRTRNAFVTALRQGYRVSGFYRSVDRRCFYVLTQCAAMRTEE